MSKLTLELLEGNFIICRLSATSSLPAWAFSGPFISITKTNDELSIITIDDNRIPRDIKCERQWKCLKFQGSFSFDMIGVLSSILNPLAHAEIPILAVSTFDTDYVMIKEKNLEIAIDVLKQNGHIIHV